MSPAVDECLCRSSMGIMTQLILVWRQALHFGVLIKGTSSSHLWNAFKTPWYLHYCWILKPQLLESKVGLPLGGRMLPNWNRFRMYYDDFFLRYGFIFFLKKAIRAKVLQNGFPLLKLYLLQITIYQAWISFWTHKVHWIETTSIWPLW